MVDFLDLVGDVEHQMATIMEKMMIHPCSEQATSELVEDGKTYMS